MPNFRYRATSSDGSPQRGVIEARDLNDAKLRLTGRGWKVHGLEVAKLPRPRTGRAEAPVPPPRLRVLPYALLLLLVLGLVILLLLDPYGWELL